MKGENMSGENFIYNLSEKLKYSKDGIPDNETATLEFRKPGMNEFEYVTNLNQFVMNAIAEMQRDNVDQIEKAQENKTQNDEDRLPTGQELKAILMSAKKTKFITIAKEFKPLALRTGTVDGKTALKETLINRLSIDDYTNLICEYIAFFIAPSVFSA